MSEFNALKRKFETLRIVDEEAPKITKKNFIQDAEFYILGKRIQSIHLVQPLQHIIKVPDIIQTFSINKEKYNPFLYIDRPLSVEKDEQ